MRRTKIAGLCLIGVLVVGTATAASASANPKLWLLEPTLGHAPVGTNATLHLEWGLGTGPTCELTQYEGTLRTNGRPTDTLVFRLPVVESCTGGYTVTGSITKVTLKVAGKGFLKTSARTRVRVTLGSCTFVYKEFEGFFPTSGALPPYPTTDGETLVAGNTLATGSGCPPPPIDKFEAHVEYQLSGNVFGTEP